MTPLVIKVNSSVPNGTQNKWTDFTDELPNLTKRIATPAINKNTDIGAIVSGIPTPFARANLFNSALNFSKMQEGEESTDLNLNAYYDRVCSEWRGFIACIAMDYSRLSVKRVYMNYSRGTSVLDTPNVYEPKGAFGNMLFDRRQLWADKDAPIELRGVPFIDIIKFDNQVVGGTSPETLLFTSPAYAVSEGERKGRPYVEYATGKFIDPLKNDLSEKHLLDLYAFVGHVIANIKELDLYYAYLADDRKTRQLVPNYAVVKTHLNKWYEEIREYARQKNYKLDLACVPNVGKFAAPFAKVFEYKDRLSGINGIISGAEGADEGFDPKDLLLKGDAEIARIIIEGATAENAKNLPVYVLEASIKGQPGESAYFALPLSPLGVRIFGKNIGALVGQAESGSSIASRIEAIYYPDAEKNNLEVKLHLKMIEGQEKELKEIYTSQDVIIGSDLILWPNFISKQWNRYFLYSEMPHNTNSTDCPFRAFPFVGDELNGFNAINDENGEPLYVVKDGHDVDADYVGENQKKYHLETTMHIVSNEATTDNAYKYEIIECNHPFKGVKLVTQKNRHAGFLIIRYSTVNSSLPNNMLDNPETMIAGVSVGIDFGSTNTSIAFFRAGAEGAEGLTFHDRRVSLLNVVKPDDDEVAGEKELFFFQSRKISSNSIKSVLTLHDPRRLADDGEAQEISKHGKEVKGGFPCFNNNLPINRVDNSFRQLVCSRVGQIDQVHNMKWMVSERQQAFNTAYLKTLMLIVYAELFDCDQKLYPQTVKWSYPSSMSISMVNQYQEIWNSLKEVDPLTFNGKEELRISEVDYSMVSAQASSINNPLLRQKGDLLGKEDEVFDFKPDDNSPVSFKPVPIIRQGEFFSMTEACAVANYLTKANNITVKHIDALTICFDIGGSTTDISALCMLRGQTGAELTMIKQNSIRFAAQRVSQATKHSRNFRSVLLNTCDQFGLHIQGLNLGEDKYTPETAPYYFEQIVDRLNAQQLPYFYQQISGQCRELMCVDLYVTGLILYYAGLLTRKLIKQVRQSPECMWRNNPLVNIAFAGKGSRIMEWLSIATNPTFAEQYYQAMFLKGIGEQEYAQFISDIHIVFPKEASDHVKYEVSMGLADNTPTLMRPSDNKAIEIIGEAGFSVRDVQGNYIDLEADNSITEQMMKRIGNEFYGQSQAGVRFMDFCGLFYQVAQQYFGIKMTPEAFNAAWQNMNLLQYIRNTPEFRKAEENRAGFDYVAPILILEGMKFYDDFLLKGVCQ